MKKGELSILIVDDDTEDLLLTESLLLEGFKGVALEVDLASSFDEGLSQIEKTPYDAFIFDYRLGAKSGLDLLRDVRARGIDTPVVFLTGQGDEEVAVAAMRLGAADYLLKSKVSESLFRSSLRYVIELHEKEKLQKQTEQQLREMNQELQRWVKELESHSRASVMINDLDAHLQVCVSSEEAYAVIARRLPQFLPKRSGALCVFDGSRNLVEAVAVWGDDTLQNRVFTPAECWGFRRGRPYSVRDSNTEIVCPHLRSSGWTSHLCLPMTALSGTLGVLVLQGPPPGATTADREPPAETGAEQRFAETLAEHIGLALANLKLSEALRTQSVRDPLTGLFNRRYMEESLLRAVSGAARHNLPVAVLMLDLDRFKEFNDARGHAAGDALLRDVGAFLQSHTRKEDVACRYGGDEFVVILPEVSLLAASLRADQIRQEFHKVIEAHGNGGETTITLSIGIAGAPEHGTTSKALLEAADAALYKAKRAGCDRVVIEPTPAPPNGGPVPAQFETALAATVIHATEARKG